MYKDLPEVTVGNRIEKQRLSLNLSRKDLAAAVGVSVSTIEDYEASRTYPSPDMLTKIANTLKMPVEYFFDDYYRFVFSDFSSFVKNWRTENNLTLCQASKLLGVHYRTIKGWEGIRVINRIHFEKLRKYLNL